MSKFAGVIVLLVGLLSVVTGFVSGHSGPSVPDNVLGLFSFFTAFCVFGGAVTTFCGFALIVLASGKKTA